MKIYNSLNRQVEQFEPLDAEHIRIYSCGPTVYDQAHIGNLATFIYADTLRRAVKIAFPDATIKHVMNITDVDDKTIKRSRSHYPELEPTAALQKLTHQYEELFMRDMKAIGADIGALSFLRATDQANITAMQALIVELVNDKVAYLADDGIYFSIDQYQKKGRTYGQLVDIPALSEQHSRVNNDEYDKDSIHDFALWKRQKDDEPAWEFEIDGTSYLGRPGWHIECSAMSTLVLGQPFDLHTGGVDLKFPHHENEIAQSTATSSHEQLARYFVHNEHVLVDSEKMAKSANNFYTLDGITTKGYDPLAYRLLILQSHYRNQAHFSFENLEAAQNHLKNLRNFSERRFQPTNQENGNDTGHQFEQKIADLKKAITDDLNTPLAIKIIASLVDDYTAPATTLNYNDIPKITEVIDELFGLNLSEVSDITASEKELIQQREVARANGEWGKSDQLRTALTQQKIGVNDTPTGPIWYRL